MITPPDTAHPLVLELVRVHDLLRDDLRACRELAHAAVSDAPPAQLREAVDQLAGLALFPVVRRGAPQLAAVLVEERALTPVLRTWTHWPDAPQAAATPGDRPGPAPTGREGRP